MAILNSTQIPNFLLDEEIRKMSDTELRVVLIVMRATLGWLLDNKTGMRKKEDWISTNQLIEKTGRQGQAITNAIESCIINNWIEIRDRDGNILDTKNKRTGKKMFFRVGKKFLTEEQTSMKIKEVELDLHENQRYENHGVQNKTITKELSKDNCNKDKSLCITLKKLITYFYELVKEKKGFKPKITVSDIVLLKAHLKENNKNEEEIKSLFTWFIQTEKFKDYPTIRTALSSHSVNLYRKKMAAEY